MTEYDLFVECIPMIAEMIVICRKLSGGEYQDWKQETIEQAPDTVKGFMAKVFIVIDKYVLETAGNSCDVATKELQP